MDMKAQGEFHKEDRKNRKLEIKAEYAKQQQGTELQKLEHTRQHFFLDYEN